MKIFTVVGARPQFIKAAAVSRAFRDQPLIEETLIHTGQHFDGNMSQVFFEELGIPAPGFHLGIAGGSHGYQTGRMLEEIEKILLSNRPDTVLVYGDTNSTLAGALAATKLHIPVAHVEAGLRSFNRAMPEETNRVLTDHVSEILFAPTAAAVENLSREGFPGDRVHLVGDVMFDASLMSASLAESQASILSHLGLKAGEYVLATVHRAENTDCPERLEAIFGGLSAVAGEIPVVLPLHPRTRKSLASLSGGRVMPMGIHIIDPVGYLEMVALEKNARLVATDSGGVQKEAFFFRVPCVTLRDETEWVELVQLGWNNVVPPSSAAAVAEAVLGWLDQKGSVGQPYGDGNASKRIAEALVSFFN